MNNPIDIMRRLNELRLALSKKWVKGASLNPARANLHELIEDQLLHMSMSASASDMRLLSYTIRPRENLNYLRNAIDRIIASNINIVLKDESECISLAKIAYGVKS